MNKMRIYLDTSVISFLYADDAPELRDITREFCDQHMRNYDVCISQVVLLELGRTHDVRKRNMLRAAVVQYQLTPVVLDGDASAAVEQLVHNYMDNRIFSEKMREDAIHVAICTTLAFDALVSWNFRHLANVHQQLRIAALNAHMGYRKKLNLVTPLELMDESTHQ